MRTTTLRHYQLDTYQALPSWYSLLSTNHKVLLARYYQLDYTDQIFPTWYVLVTRNYLQYYAIVLCYQLSTTLEVRVVKALGGSGSALTHTLPALELCDQQPNMKDRKLST